MSEREHHGRWNFVYGDLSFPPSTPPCFHLIVFLSNNHPPSSPPCSTTSPISPSNRHQTAFGPMTLPPFLKTLPNPLKIINNRLSSGKDSETSPPAGKSLGRPWWVVWSPSQLLRRHHMLRFCRDTGGSTYCPLWRMYFLTPLSRFCETVVPRCRPYPTFSDGKSRASVNSCHGPRSGWYC